MTYTITYTGKCNAFRFNDYCGKPARCFICDMLEVTKPTDKVRHYKPIKSWQLCGDHTRHPYLVNVDGTVIEDDQP